MHSFRTRPVPHILLLALILLFATFSATQDRERKSEDVPATVIAHLPLPRPTGSQMLLQKNNGKTYLYVQQAARQGFMIVDVSKPETPFVLKGNAEVAQATAGNLEMVSPDVAIASEPEKKPNTLTSTNHPTSNVRVLDMSDPKNPKVAQEFDGVTSVLPDGGHGLIYLTNNDGLWVLRYRKPALLEPRQNKPPCSSESQIQAMPPDCG